MPTAPKAGTPEMREMLRDLRPELQLQSTSSTHFGIISKDSGEPLRDGKGKPVRLPSSPKPSMVPRYRDLLVKVGAIERNGSKPVREHETDMQLRIERSWSTREGQERVEATNELRERLEPLLMKAGGMNRLKPGDMARIAARAYEIRTGEEWALDSALTSVSYFLGGRALGEREIERLEKLAEHLESVPDARLEWFGMLREVLGLDSEIVPGRHWPYTVKPLLLTKLFADFDYQRPVQEKFVRDMALRFDERLVGVLNVSEREDGEYAIIDGLQRKTAMERVGKTAAFCCVHTDLTQAQEAVLFYHHNRDRKPVHPYYDYRARLVAGDPIIQEIERIVTAQGFKVDTQSQGKLPGERERNLAAIRTLEDTYSQSSDVREEALTPTLNVIFRNWLGRPYATDSSIIRGMGRFFAVFADDEIQWERFEGRLAHLGPQNILGRAVDLGRSSRGVKVAQVLVEAHNSAVKKSEQLDARAILPRKAKFARLQ